jgi:hypothetical protein
MSIQLLLQKTGSVMMFSTTTSWQLANKMCNICVHVCVYTYMYACTQTMYVQQNSFNLTSNSLEILIIQHLRRVVPRFEVLLVTRKTLLLTETGIFQGHV